MGRKPYPIHLMLHHGKKHLTKNEIDQRKEAESRFQPKTNKVICPKWLGPEPKEKWEYIATEKRK